MNSASTEYMMKSATLETRWPSRKTVIAALSESDRKPEGSDMTRVEWATPLYFSVSASNLLGRSQT